MPPSTSTPRPPILKPGRNCWRLSPCDRLAFLIDGCDYFEAVAAALAMAQRRIFIVGWDFDAGMQLRPGEPDSPRIGDALRLLVDQRPELEVYILIWRGSILFGENSEIPPLSFGDWAAHERIHMELDGHTPIGGCHHQKIVCIDDTLAFLGGMDLTERRWDDRGHACAERRFCEGVAYDPVHDLQTLFDGRAARDVTDIARRRWLECTGEELSPPTPVGDPWPADIAPALRGKRIAIARTVPEYDGDPGAREIEMLLHDALSSARETIYIETQYFALPEAASLLGDRLGQPDCPEIVILATKRSNGMIEQYAMAQERDYLFARLREADRFGRLRLFYSVAPDNPELEIKLHSKALFVDDHFVRIGSSNLNRRSMGLDTECDIAFEADNQKSGTAIVALRTALLAEHLGCEATEFAKAQKKTGSLIAAIDLINAKTERLKAYTSDDTDTDTRARPFGRDIVDPSTPFTLTAIWTSLSE